MIRLGSPEIAAAVKVGDWVLTDYGPRDMWDTPRVVQRVREGTKTQSGRTVEIHGIGADLDAAWVREIVVAP